MVHSCSTCGAGIDDGALRCPSCGTPTPGGAVSLSKDGAAGTPAAVSLGKDVPAPRPVDLGKPFVPDPELRSALPADRAVAGPGTVPAPTPAPVPSEDQRARKSRLFGIAAVVLLLLGAGGVYALTRGDDSPPTTATAGDPFPVLPSLDPTTSGSPDGEPSGTATEPTDDSTALPPPDDSTARAELRQAVFDDADRASTLDGVWVAQLASSSAGESDSDFLARYHALKEQYGDEVLLVWSGDWSGSFGPSSASSWVVMDDGIQEQTTQPVLDWCAQEGWGHGECWAKRLDSEGDDPSLNTDHYPADERNN